MEKIMTKISKYVDKLKEKKTDYDVTVNYYIIHLTTTKTFYFY